MKRITFSRRNRIKITSKRQFSVLKLKSNDVFAHKEFFDSLGKKLGFKDPDDWFKISKHTISKHGGDKILSKYNNSIAQTLQHVYPEREWLEWKFLNSSVPPGFWQNSENQMKFLEWLGQQLEFKTMEDWYNLKVETINKYGGAGLFHYFNQSVYTLLHRLYPHYEWLPWKFTVVTHGFWQDTSNQLKFMSWFAKQLGLNTMEDWYKLSIEELYSHGGATLSQLYNDSPAHMLKSLYPEYEWLPWRFSIVPDGYWENENHQIKFLDWIAKTLHFKDMEDWYNITYDTINQMGGRRILQVHNDSVSKMLKAVYPKYEWMGWKFQYMPQKFWEDIDNQRRYLEWLGKQLHFNSMEDWYNISTEHITAHNGSGILQQYNYSHIQMLEGVYPQYEWLPWKFKFIPMRFRHSLKNQTHYLEWLSKQLNIKTLEDWYKIPNSTIVKYGGYRLLNLYKDSSFKMLQTLHPHYHWEESKFE